MTQQMEVKDPRRLVGWLAVIGAVLGWAMAGLAAAAADFNVEALGRPTLMLAFSAESQNLYRLSMWADILGWYLPFLAVGSYLWGRMRQRVGVMADIALTGVVAYAILGIVGASSLTLTFAPLADLHAGREPMAKVAAEASWLALQYAAKGIWNAEAPVFLLWGMITARFLRAEKWGFGRLLTVDLCLFAIEFALNLLGMRELGEEVLTLTLLIHPLWLFLFGMGLLRARGPVLMGAGKASPA